MSQKLTWLDRPPAGWFVVDVMRAGDHRKREWCALMIDVDPDELKNCKCKTAFLYVHPDDYRPQEDRVAREAWVRIPGKHRNLDTASAALEAAIAATPATSEAVQ